MKDRNLSIELLKFFAVLIVANSHMELAYGKYSYLATGGAIGDCLFFFASGFTLFLGRNDRFDNWYKRRISRIYPSVFAWALITSFANIQHPDIKSIIIEGGGWFVTCIMIYYVLLYLIRKFAEEKPAIPFIITAIIIASWYFYEDKSTFFMYGNTYFKWGHFFLFMLLGAYVGNGSLKIHPKPVLDTICLLCSLGTFYTFFILGHKYNMKVVLDLQVLSIIPLMGVPYYSYKLCCFSSVNSFMKCRIGWCVRFISGLCLESYIVQSTFITDRYNFLFPLNIIVIFICIIIGAYVTRSLGRVILQTFQKEDFHWDSIFKMVTD